MDIDQNLCKKKKKLVLGQESLRKLENTKLNIQDAIRDFLTSIESNKHLSHSEKEFCALLCKKQKRIKCHLENLYKKAQSGIYLLENTIRQLEAEHHLNTAFEQEHLSSITTELFTTNTEVHSELQHVPEAHSENDLIEENTAEQLERAQNLNAAVEVENLSSFQSQSATIINQGSSELQLIEAHSKNDLIEENTAEQLETAQNLNVGVETELELTAQNLKVEMENLSSFQSQSPMINNNGSSELQLIEAHSENDLIEESTAEQLDMAQNLNATVEVENFSSFPSQSPTTVSEGSSELQLTEAHSENDLIEENTEQLDTAQNLNATVEVENLSSFQSQSPMTDSEGSLEMQLIKAHSENDFIEENTAERSETVPNLNAAVEVENMSSFQSQSLSINNQGFLEQQVIEAHSENDLLEENTAEQLEMAQNLNATTEVENLSSFQSQSLTISNEGSSEQQVIEPDKYLHSENPFGCVTPSQHFTTSGNLECFHEEIDRSLANGENLQVPGGEQMTQSSSSSVKMKKKVPKCRQKKSRSRRKK